MAKREQRRGRKQDDNKRQFRGRRKTCVFCRDKVDSIDYKQADSLRSFLTDRGKIQPRRRSGACAKHQRQLAVAIKRARHLALLPFTTQLKPGHGR
ncbi:MAG: 30S ribosomal protein S18 [Chloroflexi bacterium]|nr:MAG: 30S ribosomal protein S18 [Anaerolineaceae bacterium 4572_32.2]RLC85540.1 MAG: 30S ribosomal protein S18 [Chloroflexota bacterium]HEY71733.1 30S ribosomal protein S18 [Thermoflexia bacterium]